MLVKDKDNLTLKHMFASVESTPGDILDKAKKNFKMDTSGVTVTKDGQVLDLKKTFAFHGLNDGDVVHINGNFKQSNQAAAVTQVQIVDEHQKRKYIKVPNLNMTLKEFKEHMFFQVDWPIAEQRFLFRGKEMNADYKTLKQYGVNRNARLVKVKKFFGGY